MEKLIRVQQELNSIIEDERKKLEEEKEELKKEKEEWEKLANKLNKVQISGKRIKLDVGGQIFATSLSTLTSQKGSFFEAMFSGRWETKPEDDGCYFIDRDPTVFGHILNYLRGQLPTLDILSSKKLHLLKEDAEFYQLPELSDYLNTLVTYRFDYGPNYKVSSDGLKITKTSPQDQWDVTAITNPIPSSGVHHLNFKMVNSQNGFLMVGVCPSSINQSRLQNFQHSGWYLYCWNGKIYSGPPQSVYEKTYYTISPLLTRGEVGVKMDMTNRQISFIIDGADRGVAFKDIPVNQSLSFCVLFLNCHDSVRIMQ